MGDVIAPGENQLQRVLTGSQVDACLGLSLSEVD